MLICIFCFTIYTTQYEEQDICPECEVGELIYYDEYLERKHRLNQEVEDDET